MTAFVALAHGSSAIAATRSRKEKVRLLAELLASLAPEEIASAVGWLAAEPPGGPLGLGYVHLRALCNEPPATAPTLSVLEVGGALDALRAKSGAALTEAAAPLFAALTDEERTLLVGSMTNALRQGSLAGILLLAIAQAAGAAEEDVRRVAMLAGSTARAADAFLGVGRGAPHQRTIQLFSPVAPMLAKTADNVVDAVEEIARVRVEWKVDGVRAQIHKDGDRIRVYSRQGRDITAACARIRELAQIAANSAVLDAEIVLALEDGSPRPFQETFSALASDHELPGAGQRLVVYAFDCLHRDGRDLVDAPLEDRARVLAEIVPAACVMPHLEPESASPADDANDAHDANDAERMARIQAFFADARARGHEGVMVKDLASPYSLGARGDAWRKVKEVVTVDLVVIAVEHGSGRRKGWLSNLHLGARRADGTFCMVGKTFKGLTDEMLAFQTKRLGELATKTSDWVVEVRPELVVEIAFNDVQRSPRYPGGIALRFARVVRYREDKRASDADTLESLVARLPKAAPKKQLSLFDE